jgi:8-oxo-dGTP diphosphatase
VPALPARGFVPGQTITVVAAVVERDGRFLVTKRIAGVHLEGYWEFPGGKIEPDESDAVGLAREMAEELGVQITSGALLHSVSHTYEDRIIDLRFYACSIQGEPRALLDQEIRWVTRAELAELPFPPADRALIRSLAQSTATSRTATASRPPIDPKQD